MCKCKRCGSEINISYYAGGCPDNCSKCEEQIKNLPPKKFEGWRDSFYYSNKNKQKEK